MSSKEITKDLALKKAVAAMAVGRVGGIPPAGDPRGEVGVLKVAPGTPAKGAAPGHPRVRRMSMRRMQGL